MSFWLFVGSCIEPHFWSNFLRTITMKSHWILSWSNAVKTTFLSLWFYNKPITIRNYTVPNDMQIVYYLFFDSLLMPAIRSEHCSNHVTFSLKYYSFKIERNFFLWIPNASGVACLSPSIIDFFFVVLLRRQMKNWSTKCKLYKLQLACNTCLCTVRSWESKCSLWKKSWWSALIL